MSINMRRSQRYSMKRPVHVSLGQQRMAFGTLTDISKDGLGFRSRQMLSLGTVYTVAIGEFGALLCRIVNHSDIDRYGAVFTISDRRKQRLEAQILELVAPGKSA